MGKGDNRRTLKMRRRKNQKDKKNAVKQSIQNNDDTK